MKISYKNRKIQDLCENRKDAVSKLGEPCAKQLIKRLFDLEAASVLGDVVAGKPHILTGSRAGQFAFRLDKGVRLVLTAGDDPCPVDANGAMDWSSVTIVCIEFIGDYHD